uniref:Uncharacterized protein n=1 Tax=Arundo donax TaxID=35708 RepID=A0A0A8YMH0_ARUDO
MATEDAAEHWKMGQSEDRGIYEEGATGLENFCSITIDGWSRSRLSCVHLQIIEAKRSFQAVAKEHVAAAARLKETFEELQ